jgi:hypothetical protein
MLFDAVRGGSYPANLSVTVQLANNQSLVAAASLTPTNLKPRRFGSLEIDLLLVLKAAFAAAQPVVDSGSGRTGQYTPTPSSRIRGGVQD